MDAHAVTRRLAGKAEARIGHQGRPGIRAIGDGLPLGRGGGQHLGLARLVMVMGGNDPPTAQRHAVDLHQVTQCPRVLGGQHVGRVQYVERPEGDIARRPDRRGHEIEAGLQPCGLDSGGQRHGCWARFGHVVPALAVPALQRRGV